MSIALSLIAHGQGASPTKGKDFWLGFMKNHEITAGESLDIFVVSDQPTSGTIDINGQGWSQSFNVVPNVVTTVTIPNSIAEVYSSGVIESKGIHITTQDTVAVFAINFSPYTADASKVLPTPTLGTNYVIASYAGFSPWDSEALIVATEDDTEIEIITSANILGFDDGDDDDFFITLNAGQCYQLIADPGGDLTGTVIKATAQSGSCRPFAVFSGAGCANIPSGCSNCDHIFEQNLPVESWGKEYFVSPLVFPLSPSTTEIAPSYSYRILAQENSTTISIDGIASLSLNAGQFQEFNNQTSAHCINADKNICVIQYMEGFTCGGNGDPSMLILDDSEKKITDITFSTVNSNVITSHYLNVVVRTEDISTVTFDGAPISPTSFQTFPNCASHMWVGFAVSEGSHNLYAPNGVNGYVYGNGDSESYAYSVGSYKPEPPISFENAICANGEVNLTIANTFFDPQWFNIQDMETPVHSGYVLNLPAPISSAIYVGVANENASGCSQEFFYSVEDIAAPAFVLEPGNTSICQHESVQLNVIPATSSATYNYVWSPTIGLSDPTIANPIATPFSTTTYNVTVSTPTGCASSTQSITITVTPGSVSSLEVTSDNPYICDGEEVHIDTEIESVIWSDNFDPNISLGDWTGILNGSASAACGSVSGTALYFTGTGERSATTLPLDVSNGGTIYFSIKIADGVAPCDNAEPGDNVVLRYSTDGGLTFPVANTIMTFYESAYPEFTQMEVEIPVGAQTSATYFKWMQVGSWAGNQDNWSIDEVFVGTYNSANFTLNWSNTATLDISNIEHPIASPSTSTTYVLDLTDNQSGCVYTDSIQVVIANPFNLVFDDTLVICDQSQVILDVHPDVAGSFEYNWNSTNGELVNSQIPQPVIDPSSSGVYTVVVTSPEGCEKSATIEVLVSEISSVLIEEITEPHCPDESILLQATLVGNAAQATIEWTSSEAIVGAINTLSANATPTQTADYIITIEDSNTGCIYTDTQTLTILQTPDVAVDLSSVSGCIVQGTIITASSSFVGNLEWEWAPSNFVSNSTTASTTLETQTSGDLTVTATNDAGCSAQVTVPIEVIGEVTNLGPDVDICEGETTLLDTGWPNDYSVQWGHGPTTPAVTVSEAGVYHVDVVGPSGCTSSDDIEVIVHAQPFVDLGEDMALCDGDSYLLTAGIDPTVDYNWSTGASGNSITITQPNDYSVIATNGFCQATDDVTFFFNPLPEDPFITEEVEFCFELPPYLYRIDPAIPGATYLWSDGSSGEFYSASTGGYYSVEVTTDVGCTSMFDLTINEVCPGAIFAPNAFTPDGDGINDVWLIQGVNIVSYQLLIWNKWGERIFETKSMDLPWLGQRKDGDEYVEAGVYPYRIIYTIDEGEKGISEPIEIMGQVMLIR